MKNFIIYLVFALLFLVIENSLIHFFFPPYLFPDVTLVLAFYLGFKNRTASGAFTAFSLGYISDVFTAGILGTSSFTLVFIFAITSALAKMLTLHSMLIKIGGTIFTSVIKGILTYAIFTFLNQDIPFYTIFPTAISTGLASPFIFAIIRRIEKKTNIMHYGRVE